METIHTFRSTNPLNAALAFSAILAVDKGVGSSVEPQRGGYAVVVEVPAWDDWTVHSRWSTRKEAEDQADYIHGRVRAED